MKKIFLGLILLCSIGVTAQNIPDPISNSYVHDYTNTLTDAQKQEINDTLISLRKQSTVEVAVVFINSLDGYPIEDWTLNLGRKWGVGGKSNNGLVILSAIKDHKWRIEVGGGLQGQLPDATAFGLGTSLLRPAYKQGDYFGGIMQLLNGIRTQLNPELKAIQQVEQDKQKEIAAKNDDSILSVVVWSIVILSVGGFIFLIVYSQKKKARLIREEAEAIRDRIKKERLENERFRDSLLNEQPPYLGYPSSINQPINGYYIPHYEPEPSYKRKESNSSNNSSSSNDSYNSGYSSNNDSSSSYGGGSSDSGGYSGGSFDGGGSSGDW